MNMKELIKYEEPMLEPSACHVGQSCYRAVIKTQNELSPLMPYINAVANTISFDSKAPVIIFRLHKYKVAIRSKELAVAVVADLIEGREAILMTVAYLNDLWEKRESIIPNPRDRKRPQPFDIYRLLPKTNCNICGELSCLAFASKLALAELDINLCTPLNDNNKDKELILNLTA